MSLDTIREHARDLQEETVALRRRLHTRPELGNDLPLTREAVLESIDGLPLEITLHATTSGIAALLTFVHLHVALTLHALAIVVLGFAAAHWRATRGSYPMETEIAVRT